MQKNKFYITTPIFYVNAKPHIGHTYTVVAADVLARAHRLAGEETFFLTGTDEHGAKIQEITAISGQSPQEFVDEVASQFQQSWQKLQLSHDRFIRTTEPAHMQAVQKAMQYMYEQGDIYKGTYEGLYCTGCEQFKTESELVDGLCPLHKRAPELAQEESYMFRLSKYQEVLLGKIRSDEIRILPETRKNEVVSFYEHEGLKDVSFSRKKVSWGIPVPWDPSHTIYVWADAFLNYLTGLGWDGSANSVPALWPADIQLMSKDIIRVHATIWPAMLLSLGLPLPKTLFVHGFLLIDGEKISKSLGNVIAPEDLVAKYGTDPARYLIMTGASFGQDGDVTWKKFDEKYTADLANGLGNLVQRVATLVENNLDNELIFDAQRVAGESALKEVLDDTHYKETIDQFMLHETLAEVWKKITLANIYVNDHKPWALVKEDPDTFLTVMMALVAMINHITWLLQPFMPDTAHKIFLTFGNGNAEHVSDGFVFRVVKGQVLFPRLDL